MTQTANVLQYVLDSFHQISDYMEKKHPERKWLYAPQLAYWDRACRALEEGRPVIWHSIAVTPELIDAVGATPICVDALANTLAALRSGVSKYIDLAHQRVPDHICGFNKTGIGLAMSGDIPKPDALVYTSTPCDSARVSYPLVAEYMGVPHVCIDMPFEESERGYAYVTAEIEESVAFLEKVTGQQLDWAALERAIEYSNQAYDLISEIAQLRKLIPCPLSSRLLFMNGMFSSSIGSPELVDFLRIQCAMGKDKARKGEGHLSDEKLRIAWVQNPISFDLGIVDWMERECNAIVTMNAFGFREAITIEDTSDRAAVFRGLAERWLRIPMVHGTSGPAEHWMAGATEICRDYSCNAAIFSGHVGCKHTWAVGKLVKDMISDRFGIPALILDVDTLDPRYRQPAAIKDKIKYFIDTIQ